LPVIVNPSSGDSEGILDGRVGEVTREQIVDAYFGLRGGAGRDHDTKATA